MIRKIETVFVTKYALSGKIQKLKCEIDEDNYAIHKGNRSGSFQMFSSKEWHRTWPEALVDAERRRTAKIASLNKQIAKLEKVKFEEPK